MNRLGWALLTTVLLGCGGKMTVEDGCSVTGSAGCARAVECGAANDKASCMETFMAQCCGNAGSCKSTEARTSAQINACASALGALGMLLLFAAFFTANRVLGRRMGSLFG